MQENFWRLCCHSHGKFSAVVNFVNFVDVVQKIFGLSCRLSLSAVTFFCLLECTMQVQQMTNGLLHEYFPKGYEFSELSDEDLQKVVAQVNHRPPKYLDYRTPQEVYFSDMLHFA